MLFRFYITGALLNRHGACMCVFLAGRGGQGASHMYIGLHIIIYKHLYYLKQKQLWYTLSLRLDLERTNVRCRLALPSRVPLPSLKGKHKTAANYLTAVNSYSQFAECTDWCFADLTASTLEQYQRWLCQRGLCMNTISAYMRSLRTLYNRFQPTDANSAASPFANVYTGRAHTAKRSIDASCLQRLYGLSIDSKSPLGLARDLFMFSFFAMGMPFADMARLQKGQIRHGKLHYARQKTAQKISIAIEPCMQQIIERYSTADSDLVFPILRNATTATLHRIYASRLRAYNRHLHKLSQLIDSSQPLTSYVARHSWASMAYSNHLDLQLIAKAMGHTKVSTTMIYIRSLFDPSLADANRDMLRRLGME